MSTTTDPYPWETSSAEPAADPIRIEAPEVTTPDSVPASGRILDAYRILDELAGDPLGLAKYTASVRDAVADVVRGRAEERKAGRPAEVTDQADLRPEMIGAADDAEVLKRLGSVFIDSGKIAEGIAGDLVAELPLKRGKPQRTVRMGDGHGFELTVNTAQPTEAFADLDDIIDVVATATIGGHGALPTANPVVEYAAGVREGIAALLEVLGAPKVKTTALDALATKLEGRDDGALAKRLRALYGRRDKGDPTVKIDRKPLAEDES